MKTDVLVSGGEKRHVLESPCADLPPPPPKKRKAVTKSVKYAVINDTAHVRQKPPVPVGEEL